MHKDKAAWAAYMRDYRRRKRSGIDRPAVQADVHKACDAYAAKLQEEIRVLKARLSSAADIHRAQQARIAELEKLTEGLEF